MTFFPGLRFDLMKILTFLFLAFPLFAGEPDASSRFVTVAVTADDIEQFGGWPIPRRWYANLIQTAFAGGAEDVSIDIAFVSADPLHPESDEYFYDVLMQHPNVSLLVPGTVRLDGPVTILGDRSITADRVFHPFSSGVTFHSERPMVTDTTNLISDLVRGLARVPMNGIVEFPVIILSADHTFREALTKEIDWKGKHVVISVENPGVTSYIVSPSGHRQSTTLLQVWMAEQLLGGNYERLLPFWEYAVIGLFCSFPFLWFAQKKKLFLGVTVSAVSWIISLPVLMLLHTAIPGWYLYVAAVWCSVAAGAFVLITAGKGRKEIPVPAEMHGKPEMENNDEVESLRYQLKYYEQLSQQYPPDETMQRSDTADIIYHPRSPVSDILKKAAQIAESRLPVLITGESGTGKEKIAQYIHQRSSRKDQPFIAVNCSSLNDGLIESELFGHEQGSFTGANKTKIGRFELANGGTLFLDEIGETTASFQTKVLRVLQENVFERVGGTSGIRIDVRIIAATNKNLKDLAAKGQFREDLYYRLHGFEVEIPALRERKDDIEVLFKHFLFTLDPALSYSPQLIEWLKEQRWQGNVRQLQSAVQRSVLNARMHDRGFIIPKDLELGSDAGGESADDPGMTAQKVLEGLRRYRFDHRSIAKVSADLALHRSTVTEYFRGWVIRLLVQHSEDRQELIESLRQGVEPVDREKFEERVDGYIEAIHSSVSEGLRSGSAPDEIAAVQFRKLPIPFRQDVLQLIVRRSSAVKR